MSTSESYQSGRFSEELFSRFKTVDTFFSDHVVPKDPVLDSALKANEEAGLPNIDVAPNQGKLLNLLAKLASAKNILEVGTLGGYSSIWMAKALPTGGKLVSLEISPEHARVAEANVARAGFGDKVEVRVGPALDSLGKMEAEGWGTGKENGPFDLVFVDADKENNWEYVKYGLKFARVGTVIVVDNIVRRGRIVEAENIEPAIVGTREVLQMMGKDERLDATALQTVGCKGWDGLAISLVVSL